MEQQNTSINGQSGEPGMYEEDILYSSARCHQTKDMCTMKNSARLISVLMNMEYRMAK